MPRILLVLCTSVLLCGGCFVMDEIDSGVEILDKNSARGAQAKDSPEKSAGRKKDGGSSLDLAQEGSEALGAVGDWWKDWNKPAPDPDDGIVRCRVDGRIQFKRESDCRALGGEPAG